MSIGAVSFYSVNLQGKIMTQKKSTKTKAKVYSMSEVNTQIKDVPKSIQSYVRDLEEQISHMTEIGLALSKEKDMNVLLEMILLEAKRIANSDGGTLYMKTNDDRLAFKIMMTDSLDFHMGGTSGTDIPFYPIKLYMDDGKPNNNMIAAYVGLTGETVNIPDAYEAEGFDFSGTRAFDEKTGYRSKSFLTVPLRDHENEIIGVLQLLNAQDKKTGDVVSFSQKVQDLVEALSSQAAVAITNKNLIKDLEDLFESFIQMIAAAIDAKSKYTGGHCQRIPLLTEAIGEAVNKCKTGPLADVHFDENGMRELLISAWLHDTGKVATPTHVVDKSTKLETILDRIHLVNTRFEIIKRDEEIKFLKRQMKLEKAGKSDEIKELRKKHRANLKQIDEDKEFINTVNIGGEFMSPDKKERVEIVAKRTWKDGTENKKFLSDEEVYNLSISRGTLTAEDRKIINDHTVHTINMLEKLPWPNKLKNVPLYAGAHHEKPDGTGYPKGLSDKELPIQPRIVALADVFEALTAKDRPYKDGKTVSDTLRIMGFMKNDSHIDPFLYDLFIGERIWEPYSKEYLDEYQLDVD